MKNALKKILLDMIPIVLGILIALFISNWSKNKEDKTFISGVMSSVNMELIENKKSLVGMIESHNSLLDTLSIYLDDESINIGETLNKTNGFQMASIKNTAWKAFINTNMNLVDYQTISELTNIAESKQTYNLQKEKTYDFLLQNVESTGYIEKEKFYMILQSLTNTEMQLLESHNALIDQN